MSPKNSSSSVQATASNQESNGRTTRAMKAKEQQNSTSQQTNSTNTASYDTKAAKEIDPASHLRMQNYPNDKVLANSNGKSKSKQEIIDHDLEKHFKAQKLKPFLWGTQVEPVSKESMTEDFAAMGYSPDTIKAMMAKNEPIKVDGCMQRPSAGRGRHVAGTGISPKKPKKKPTTKKTAVPPSAPVPEPEPEPERAPPKAASKKRKADEISADAAPQTAPEPSAVAEEHVAPSESVGGEGRQKKRRRPGRPKISAARVENSSSE
ncbi:hypothetical protein MBLNU13_g10549t1 [Cladosporium sp. NU13]